MLYLVNPASENCFWRGNVLPNPLVFDCTASYTLPAGAVKVKTVSVKCPPARNLIAATVYQTAGGSSYRNKIS